MGGRGRPARRMRGRRRRVRRRRVLLVGGLVAFGAYKMSTRDADRIEEHTGVSPEELDDAELEQAMSELGIEQQTVTSEDTKHGGSSAAGASLSARGDSTPAYVEELQKLGALHEQGILTDSEFDVQKRKVLDYQ